MTSPIDAEATLREVLRRARRRLRAHYAREGLVGLLALGVLGFAALLAAGLVAPLPAAVRAGAAVILGGGAILWVVRRALQPALRLSGEDAVALWLERAFPALQSRLISAVQLGRELPTLEERPRFSATLARAVIEEAAREAATLDTRAAVPRGTWRRAGAFALAVSALLGLLAAAAPERFGRALANLAGPEEVAPLGSATGDAPPPLIGDLSLRFQYPEYTGLPPRVVESTSGEIAAVKGTVVQIAARAAIDVVRAEIRAGLATLPLRVEGRALAGSLTVLEPGTYQFFLTGEDGERRPGSPPMKIEVERDRHPRVRILAPGGEVVVGERGRLEVRYAADDDFGLRDLSLVLRVEEPGRQEQVKRLRRFDGRPRSVEGIASLSVFDLGLRPGERVAYRLRVHDHDVVSGPKAGDSETQYLKVYSPRERHLELLEDQHKMWDQMVHLLGERIVLGEEARGRGDAALRSAEAAARRAATRAADVEERLASILSRAREDRLLGERVRAALQGLRRRLRERTVREAAWLAASVGGPEARLLDLASFMPRHVSGTEEDVLMLEKLYKQQKLDALKTLARDLVESQKRLKDLLEEYRRTRDPELKAEIEREIARLSRQIQELRAKLAELFDVDDEFVNLEAVQAGELEKAVNRMQEALKKGDLEGALRALERMAKDLQSTLEKVDLSAKAFYESAFYKTQKEMEKLLDEVHDLEAAEREIERETRSLEKAARSRAAKELDVARSEAARRIEKRLEEIAREAEKAGRSLRSRWNQELAEKAAARAADAAKALGQEDAAEALEMARRGHSHLQQLEENLSRERPWRLEPAGADLERARGHSAEAARGMGEAVRDLERLLPKTRSRLTSEEKKRLAGLARRQKRVRERAARLKRRMEEVGERAPFVSDEAKKSLEEAHEQMGQAEGELGRGRPTEAVPREQRAAQALEKLKDKLQQAMSPQGGQAGGGEEEGDRGAAMSREKVRIPGSEEHQTPKEFREDLLKAMKQAVPPAYRDLVRRYYEELVR
jgi:hypothetical protein